MGRMRISDKHLALRVYVKHGRYKDTYYTIINQKYHGLGNDRAAAERLAKELQGGGYAKGSIADMCKGFIAFQRKLIEKADPSALAERTVDDYEEAFDTHLLPLFGHMKPRDFKAAHKGKYLDTMREKGRGVRANREMAALGSAFNYGIRHGMADTNPCHGVSRNPERPRSRKPENVEVNTFLEIAKARGEGSYMTALIGLMVGITGRRRAEILGLEESSLTQEGVKVQAVKIKATDASREYLIAWSPLLSKLLAEAVRLSKKHDTPYVFAARSGAPYTDSGFKANWSKIMAAFVKAGGERFTAHDLRAMYVTEMVSRDQNPETHKNAATTRRIYDRRRKVKVTPTF